MYMLLHQCALHLQQQKSWKTPNKYICKHHFDVSMATGLCIHGQFVSMGTKLQDKDTFYLQNFEAYFIQIFYIYLDVLYKHMTLYEI